MDEFYMDDRNRSCEREKWIDLLKGFGIVLVETGHFIELFRAESPIINAIFILISDGIIVSFLCFDRTFAEESNCDKYCISCVGQVA